MFGRKKKCKKEFMAEFSNGSQVIISADTKREAIDEAIEYTWRLGNMLDVREIKNA